MLPKIYRIYLGARNTPNHTFTSGDTDKITEVLSRYFKGWTITDALGVWEGDEEASKVITVSTGALMDKAGKSPVEACAKQLKQHFAQYAVMVEEGGLASFY